MSAARAVQNYRRLCAVAPPADRTRLVCEAAEEGLQEATALLDALAADDAAAVGAAGQERPPVAEAREWLEARAWLAMHDWLQRDGTRTRRRCAALTRRA